MEFNKKTKLSGIYVIRNLINNKVYVGRAKNIFNRWKGHKKELNKKSHKNSHLLNSWNKYGEDNFEFSILELVDSLSLSKEKERSWIQHFKSYDMRFGYNKTLGGEDGEVTDEIRKKMSEMMKGEKNPFYGKEHKKDFLIKNREEQTGKKLEEEVVNKIKKSKSRNFKHFTEQEINDMIKRRKNGEKYKDICKCYGVCSNTVRKIILENDSTIEVKKLDRKIDNGNRKLNSNQVTEILNLLENGKTYKFISEKYGISSSTVKRVRMGIGYKTMEDNNEYK